MKFVRSIISTVVLLLAAQTTAAFEIPDVPDSKWINAERKYARIALAGIDADLLIVPVQGGENSFDPIERSLITRFVADRVIQSTDILVPNPTFVFRELGSHRSIYPEDDIRSLATYVRSPEVMELHAEHDRNGRFEFVVTLVNTTDGATKRTKTWPKLEYSDASPPFVAIQGILDEVVRFVAHRRVRKTKVGRSTRFANYRFPESIDELRAESAKSSLHAAAYLQLVGMLHPSGNFNEVRNQLFERSLVELSKVPSRNSDKRYFTARALAYLDRRPAAVRALGNPKNAHERALLAALNGNLITLRAEVERMGTSAMDFMAWRDLLKVETAYSKRKERTITEQFVEENPLWAPFIHRALQDTSTWASYSTASLKLGLEQLVPSEAASLHMMLDKAMATADFPDELKLTRAVWRHIEAIGDGKISGWAGQAENYSNASELDILDLAKTMAVANRIRSIEDDLSLRDIPDAALKEINEFDSLFSGHPAITLQKGRALAMLVDDSTGVEKENLEQESDAEFLNGLAWTGQMTAVAVEFARFFKNQARGREISGRQRRSDLPEFSKHPLRYYEWPKGAAWHRRVPFSEFDGGALLRCLEYTWTAFHCLKEQIEFEEQKPDASESIRADLMAKYSHRFIGSPGRAEFEIQSNRNADDSDSEIRELRSRVEAGGADWSIYYALGRELKRRGDYQAAQEAFLSYPGFLDARSSVAVRNSNFAYDAGSMFYWIGQYELALPLLEISANSGTGSGGSMSAGNRISLIKGDLEEAEGWTASRVRRYASKYAIRDLQQILHIRGQSDIAWSIFEQVQSTTQDPQMWSGTLVGHRMASATTEEIANWIETAESRKEAVIVLSRPYYTLRLAPRYLLLAGTMDRAPGPELASAVAKFGFVGGRTYFNQEAMFDDGTGPVMWKMEYVAEDGKRLDHDALVATPSDGQKAKDKEQIASRFEMLANAMSAFLQNDFDKASDAFNETAYYYFLDEYLPYYAFSAAATGRAEHLKAALEAREPGLAAIRQREALGSSERGYRFDEDLSYAVLASFEGRHEDSLDFLKRALNNRPYIEERTVYPLYQVVDLADRLYERTNVDLYREFALDLARRHTVVLPMYAWAYFIVAKYSESSAELVKSAASGLKLDPLSHRATLLPKDLIQKARDHLEKYGPPYLFRPEESIIFDT